MARPKDQNFGGTWTETKLNVLDDYMAAYVRALKNSYFHLMYIDAFAGTGKIEISGDKPEIKELIDGSVRRALKHSFDSYIFIENDPKRFNLLSNIKKEFPDKNIDCREQDANIELSNICKTSDWKRTRAVVFLDPFATELNWETIKNIANTKAMDTWILVNISSIERILPKVKMPDDVNKKWADKLNLIFGNDSWRDLYKESRNLFEEIDRYRASNTEDVFMQYSKGLSGAFEDRFLKTSQKLINRNGRIIFYFVFCAGNPRGKSIAHRIAKHLIAT